MQYIGWCIKIYQQYVKQYTINIHNNIQGVYRQHLGIFQGHIWVSNEALYKAV